MALLRAWIGIFFAFYCGAVSVYFKTLGIAEVDSWLLGASSSIGLFSIAILFFTLHEYYTISCFEDELNQIKNTKKLKDDALKSIREKKDKQENKN